MVNIFEIIKKVNRTIERFHSEFLTAAFDSNKKLLNSFFQLIQTSDNHDAINQFIAAEELIIRSEDLFLDSKRIDIIIEETKTKNIIGIEVKTSDASVREEQLSEYHNNMIQKYPDYNVIIVFLTPFNKHNLPHDIAPERIRAIKKFLDFQKNARNSIHINWDDIVDLYEDTFSYENRLFNDHRDYIKTRVTNKSRLQQRFVNTDRNRGLADFFGEECLSNFFENLSENNIAYHEDDKTIKLNIAENKNNFDELIAAFLILADSGNFDKSAKKKNEVKNDLLQRYESGLNGIFFKQLFSLTKSHSYLWLKGKDSIGIRAAHKKHSSGVSVLTIDDENTLILNKYR